MEIFTLDDNNIVALLSSVNPELEIDLFQITGNDITINEEALSAVRTDTVLQKRLITHLIGNLGVIPGITSPAEAKAYAPILHILYTLLPVDDYPESWKSFIANQNSRNTIYTILQDVITTDGSVDYESFFSYFKLLEFISSFLYEGDVLSFEYYCVSIAISLFDMQGNSKYGAEILGYIYPPTQSNRDSESLEIKKVCHHIVATPLNAQTQYEPDWSRRYQELVSRFCDYLPIRYFVDAIDTRSQPLSKSRRKYLEDLKGVLSARQP